jgi:hypothetical protein
MDWLLYLFFANCPFQTKVVNFGVRDSTYVLDGLLSHVKILSVRFRTIGLNPLGILVLTLVKKTKEGSWGQGVVEELAQFISSKNASYQGFSARNIWRMKKFYETYSPYPKLSTTLTEIGWSNHLHILSKTKTIEEKEYYLMLLLKI